MVKLTRKDIEIMAPAGSFESLFAAVQSGADSVYFGVEKLNMRAKASRNFSLQDLSKIASICRENNLKSYLTLNTIMYDEDLSTVHEIIHTVKDSGITAIVASDPAVEYMTEFYKYLKEGNSKADALRTARNYMKAKYPNPYFWAVFILHGEG